MKTHFETTNGSSRHLRGRHVFVLTFVATFVLMALWSMASPLFSGPDEPDHVMKAAAVVRGQLLGELNPDGEAPSTSPYGAVTLPKFYAVDRKVPGCYHEEPQIPASCDDTLVQSTTTPSKPDVVYHGPSSAQSIAAPVQPPPGMRCPYGQSPPCPDYVTSIYNARYPPLYYVLVGLPSLLGDANWAVYLMRLVSAALSAIFLALAMTTGFVWSKNRFVTCGVIVASTPMVLYLGGVVNPSGLEIAAALAVYSSGVVLVREHLFDPPLTLIVVLAGSASVFELVRGLSPFWLGCSAVALLGLSNLSGLRALIHRRSVQIGATAVATCGVAALVWIFKEHALIVQAAPLPSDQSTLVVLEHSFQLNADYLPTMIGVFGSFDTFSPLVTYLIWYGLIGFVVLSAAMLLRRREVAVVIGLMVATVVVPVLISSSQVHRYGYTWSGRDGLPLAVGLPIVAFALLGQTVLRNHRRRLATVVVVACVLGQFAAFFEALRRYVVGTSGPDFAFLVHPSWRPPFGPLVLTIAEALVLAMAGIAAVRLIAAESSRTMHIRRRAHDMQWRRIQSKRSTKHFI